MGNATFGIKGFISKVEFYHLKNNFMKRDFKG